MHTEIAHLPSFLSSSLCSCVHLSAALLGKSGSWSWTAWRTIQKVSASGLLRKCTSLSPPSPQEEDNNTCWRGLIFLKMLEGTGSSDNSTTCISFIFCSNISPRLAPPLSLSVCTACTRLSPEAGEVVVLLASYLRRYKDLHRNRGHSSLLDREDQIKLRAKIVKGLLSVHSKVKHRKKVKSTPWQHTA